MNKEEELFRNRLFIQVHEVKKKKNQDPDFSLHLVYNAQSRLTIIWANLSMHENIFNS